MSNVFDVEYLIRFEDGAFDRGGAIGNTRTAKIDQAKLYTEPGAHKRLAELLESGLFCYRGGQVYRVAFTERVVREIVED